MTIPTNSESFEVWNTFLDLNDDVKPWLRTQVSDTAIDQNTQLITDMACAWVQDYCGRPFAPKQYDWRFDGWSGWNGTHILLPRYPVLEIVSCTEYWGASGPHTLAESEPTAQADGYQLVPHTGRLTRCFPGNIQKPWFPGSANIEVVWIAGYNPIPPAVRVATLEMIAYWVRNTQQAASGARAGAGAGDYDAPGPGQMLLWAGVPDRVRALLDPFIHIGIG